jgi:hypothetical protein
MGNRKRAHMFRPTRRPPSAAFRSKSPDPIFRNCNCGLPRNWRILDTVDCAFSFQPHVRCRLHIVASVSQNAVIYVRPAIASAAYPQYRRRSTAHYRALCINGRELPIRAFRRLRRSTPHDDIGVPIRTRAADSLRRVERRTHRFRRLRLGRAWDRPHRPTPTLSN